MCKKWWSVLLFFEKKKSIIFIFFQTEPLIVAFHYARSVEQEDSLHKSKCSRTKPMPLQMKP